MKKYKYFTLLILVILMTIECKAQNLKAIIPSINENNKDYIIQSPSIRFTLPEVVYWDSIQIVRNSKIYNKKELYLEDGEFYFVYDSLQYKEYEVLHISSFREKYSYKVKLESDTLLKYPKDKLEYNSKDFKYSDLSEILKSDTLKLVIHEIDCYNFEEKYFEIIKSKNNQELDTTIEYQIHLSVSNFENRLNELITQNLKLNNCKFHTCSSIYSLKIKNNKIYKYYGCCESEEFIEKLTKKD